MAVLLLLKIAGKFAQHVRRELSLPTDSLLWDFHPNILSGGKKRGKCTVECFVISVFFLKREGKIPAMTAVSNQSNPLCFFSPPHSPVFQKCDVQSLSEDQELQNWRKTETNVIAPTVSRTHARPHPHKQASARAHSPPHLPNSVPRVVYHSVKYRGATESS